MSIIKNHVKDNFTQIPNIIINDKNISDKSFRILCYLLSKDSGWKVYNKDIQNNLNIKQSSTIAKCWKELECYGYITRERIKSSEGSFSGGYKYHISNKPILAINHNMEEPIYGETQNLNKTKLNNNTKDNNTKTSKYDEFISYLKRKVSIPSKVTSTKQGKELFKNIDDKKQLCIDYINHQQEKQEFAKRITAFMEDYKINKKVEVENKDIHKMRFSSLETFNNFNIINDYKYELLKDGFIKVKDLTC